MGHDVTVSETSLQEINRKTDTMDDYLDSCKGNWND